MYGTFVDDCGTPSPVLGQLQVLWTSMHLHGWQIYFSLSFAFSLRNHEQGRSCTSCDGFINWQCLFRRRTSMHSFIHQSNTRPPWCPWHNIITIKKRFYTYWYRSMTHIRVSIHPVCTEPTLYGFACTCMRLPTTLILIQTKIWDNRNSYRHEGNITLK